MITVAHRVPTVIDSDMVMVLSYGMFFYFPTFFLYIEMESRDWSSDVCSSDLHSLLNIPKLMNITIHIALKSL